LSELKATDQSSPGNVRYVVGDFNHSPPGTYWTRAWHDGETDLDVEWEAGFEALAEAHGEVREWTQTWPEGDVAEAFDLWLFNDGSGSHVVRVEVEPLADDLDLDVALFASDHATYFGNPGDAVESSENEAPGQVEWFEHRVRTDDWYGLVVTSRSDRGGDYVIRVGPADAVAAGEPSGPTEFSFSSAPNPFRGSSRLDFALTREQAVDLVVYDVAGRAVRRLESGPLAAGHHSRTWDGRDEAGTPVAAGVYLARLRSEERAVTHKLIRLP
ncbi:MAG TPA: FlgD immunoglobulin-like domain containing protein, partial [bacterium]|nr:FlgD immunoglobulin-like domain containing protein [bacterium]